MEDVAIRAHDDSGVEPPGVDRSALAELISRRASDNGVCSGPVELGVKFMRVSRPTSFRKNHSLGPSVTVVASGTKRVRFGDLELRYGGGSYIVIAGETSYDADVVGASPAQPFLAATIDLPVDLIVKTQLALAGDTEPAAVPTPAPAFVARFDAALYGVAMRLLTAMDDVQERRIVAPLVREELVFRILRCNAAAVVNAAVRTRDAGTIHAAMRFIRDNASRPLSVRSIARHVAMSPSHFAHRFRDVARVSPMRFVKQVRLDAARVLMLAKNPRVAEVAAHVGYESSSHFSRDFKVAFGIPPADFARRIAGSGMSTAVSDIARTTPRA